MADAFPILAILGGTGPQGSGLALRWAKAGYRVIIGSREATKSVETAAKLNARLGSDKIEGETHTVAAERAQIVVLAVPYAAQAAVALGTLNHLKGKVLIDVTVPLIPPKVGTVQLPPEGSAVAAMQRQLGPEIRVVSAFQNTSAQHLHDLDHVIDCDVLVCGDDNDACEATIALVEAAGMRGWRAGPLANSAAAEALTSVLIQINRRYKIAGSGIRITGSSSKPPE
jgi:8-hydroxy-5-deazaflavin:NADPH oxidoreductase